VVGDTILNCKDNKSFKILFFLYLYFKWTSQYYIGLVLLSSFASAIVSVSLVVQVYHYSKLMTQ
jgi:hypothetical protein